MPKWLKAFLLFFVLGLLVYSNSLNNKFLLDDYFFLGNPELSSPQFVLSQWNPFHDQALGVLDTHQTLEYYRPLAHILLDYSYAVFKGHFWKYHSLNLLLFVSVSFLIYLLIQRLTGNFILSFFAGFLYLLHPINGIIVNYISASVFAFQLICSMLVILFLLIALEKKNNRLFYFLSLFFTFLSLFWHESGVMIPLYISAVVFVFRQETLKQKFQYLFPYFLIVFLYAIFRFCYIHLEVAPFSQLSLLQYLAGLFQLFGWYISKLFLPLGIVMQWVVPLTHEHILKYALGFYLGSLIFLLLMIKYRKEKIILLGLLWFMIGFLPACFAAYRNPGAGIEIEPHWFIFSSIGFFIIAAYFLNFVLEYKRSFGLVILFLITFGLGSLSHAYNQIWADQKTYATYWSQQLPQLKLTYFYLADAYKKEGDLDKSIKFYNKALSGSSLDLEIYNNLGVINNIAGRWDEAIIDYKKALNISSTAAKVYHNLGALYFQKKQFNLAKKYYLKSLFYNPIGIESRRGLALIYLNELQYQKSIDLCLENLKIVNNDEETMHILITAYFRSKNLVAFKKYAVLLIHEVSDPAILIKLGSAFLKNNQISLSLECYIKTIRIAPHEKRAYWGAADLFEKLGKNKDAVYFRNLANEIH